MSESSLMEAKKVESLTSVDMESNQNLMLSQDKPLRKSLEDVSAELVKETLAKALSGEININDDAGSATVSFVDSPSRMILVQPQNSSESQSESLIDTPSTTNLTQINECYENSAVTNVNDQPLTDNRDPEPATVPEENSEKPTENVSIIITQESEVNNPASGSELNDKVEEETELKGDASNVSTIESKNELYSSSSTHLCSKLSEVFEKTLTDPPSQTSEHQSEREMSEQNISEQKLSDSEPNISEQKTSEPISKTATTKSGPNILEQKTSEPMSETATTKSGPNVLDHENTSAHKSESVRSIDLSKHDIRTSVSLIESMSDILEQAVDDTIGDNHKVLEEKFDSQHEIGHAGTDFTAVQDMGHTMLKDDVKTSKASSNNIYSKESMGQDLTENDIGNLRMRSNHQSEAEETISKLKIEVESYRTELKKIRPDSNDVVLRCNALDIDPAIATVPHLLDLLTTSRAQNITLQDEVQDLTTKLSNTTNLLDDQKHLYQELKKKLKSIDVEDDRRREKNVIEMDNYYKNKLNEIETELKERGIHIEADFWTPHLTNQREFLSQIHMHKDEVAEEELRRELSNAGTDKFSDDEPIVFPVEGYRESFCETSKTPAKYLEDDQAPVVAVPAPSGAKGKEEISSKSKTCAIQ